MTVTGKQNNIVDEYIETVIKHSWTWNRLTVKERQAFLSLGVFDKIKGNNNQRIEQLNSIYIAFLAGCGYDSFKWREDETK